MISVETLRKAQGQQQLEALRLAVARGLPLADATKIASTELGWTAQMVARLAKNPVAEAIEKLGGAGAIRERQHEAGVRLKAKALEKSRGAAAFLPIRVVETTAVTNGWIQLGIQLDRDRLYSVARKA